MFRSWPEALSPAGFSTEWFLIPEWGRSRFPAAGDRMEQVQSAAQCFTMYKVLVNVKERECPDESGRA